MKLLKDYIHFYLGCQVFANAPDDNEESIRTLIGIDYTFEYPYRCIVGDSLTAHKAESTKPILRPLSDLTEDDFYSFNQPETEKDILITATINKRWCAGWYDKRGYEERVKEELCTDPEELLYDLEDADYTNVICCDKNGTISHGLSDDYCYLVDLPTQANWINHLRKRGFDCDRLIESCLAIDKTTLTQPT